MPANTRRTSDIKGSGLRWIKALSGLAAACIISFSLTSDPAFAHAQVLERDPAPGSSPAAAPAQVRLSFTEPVEAAFDPIKVFDERGERVDETSARVEPGDPDTLVADLQELPAGVYAVDWRVTSVDGHVVSGEYEFYITDAAAGPSEADRASSLIQGQAASLEETAGLSPTALYSVASVGIAAVVLLVLAVVALLRRGRV